MDQRTANHEALKAAFPGSVDRLQQGNFRVRLAGGIIVCGRKGGGYSAIFERGGTGKAAGVGADVVSAVRAALATTAA